MTTQRRDLNTIASGNFYFMLRLFFRILEPRREFIPAWHIEAICWHLQQVAEGKIKRLLITVPPRYGKSLCVSIAFAAWLLGRDPRLKLIVASYGQSLAAEHARTFRRLIEALDFRRLFPRLRVLRNTESEIQTTMGGGRLAVSLGGPITGRGADVVIIDDLLKVSDSHSETERASCKTFFEETLYSRLDDKENGAIIAIQQRTHEDDFAGYLIDKGGFTHLNLPAIAEDDDKIPLNLGRVHYRSRGDVLFPDLEDRETLDRIKEEIGPYAFSAQYQQNPVPPGGNRIDLELFGAYDKPPARKSLQMVIQSWDTAVTTEPDSDFSVGMTWGYRNGDWYLLHVERTKLDFPALKSRIRVLQQKWNADKVIIERAFAGIPLLDELRREDSRSIYTGYPPKGDKEIRMAAGGGKLATGKFHLPAKADWLLAFRQELRAFPNGRHDDQVDALSQFLDWIGKRHGRCWQERQLNGGKRRRRNIRRRPGRRRR